MSLFGRVAIVTGGARGIGRAYCLGLAREGARVVSADLSDSSAVVTEIEGAGGAAIGVQVDVTSQQATENLAATVIDRFGQIDILVNNAGYMTNAAQLPFE